MPAPAPSSRPLWQKLGGRPGDTLRLLDPPADFDQGALADAGAATVGTLPEGALARTDVVLAFAGSRAELARVAERLRPALDGSDVRVWIAYPKGGRADFNRDVGWEPLAALELEGVAQVALDGRWSALRFRPRAHTTRRRHEVPDGGAAAAGAPRQAGQAERLG